MEKGTAGGSSDVTVTTGLCCSGLTASQSVTSRVRSRDLSLHGCQEMGVAGVVVVTGCTRVFIPFRDVIPVTNFLTRIPSL